MKFTNLPLSNTHTHTKERGTLGDNARGTTAPEEKTSTVASPTALDHMYVTRPNYSGHRLLLVRI